MSEPLFVRPAGVRTRWASFENPQGLKGAGARENAGAKGHSCDQIEPGQSHVLMQAEGAGVVRRIWMTISDRSPLMLRGLRLEMFWDGEAKPAISVPLGDFFGVGCGRRVAFESALFSDAEGRSFLCHVPMPFRSGARIVLTNETDRRLSHLFYDVNYELRDEPEPGSLYLHAHWRRERPTRLGEDFTVLPHVQGAGRFLGACFSVHADPRYASWWGEGEVKIFLDGDAPGGPTLVGTGVEDYIGDAWGLKPFTLAYSGCTVADGQTSAYSFYRWHVLDPIWFEQDCRVTVQQIGCVMAGQPLRRLLDLGLPCKPTQWDRLVDEGKVDRLLEDPSALDRLLRAGDHEGAVLYYRQDDWASCAYFYLDRPANNLPPLAPLVERVAGLNSIDPGEDRVDM